MFNIMCAVCCRVLGDLVVQLVERVANRKAGFNWRRLSLFFVFGLLYAGLTEWFILVEIFAWLLPNSIRFANESISMKLADRAGQMHYIMQIVLDNFVINALLYLPVFYVLKEMVQGSPLLRLTTYSNGLQRYRSNWTTDCACCWIIWVPGDVVVFAVPMWLRMPANHLIGFAWTLVLSRLRGREVLAGDACPASSRKAPLTNDGLLRVGRHDV